MTERPPIRAKYFDGEEMEFESAIDCLRKNRVLDVWVRVNGDILFDEECDCHYRFTADRAFVERFIDELKDLLAKSDAIKAQAKND